MSISSEDADRIQRKLDQISKAQRRQAMASRASWLAWLYSNLPDIWHKIQGFAQAVWDWISAIFS